jgi:uncharacterized protein YukE
VSGGYQASPAELTSAASRTNDKADAAQTIRQKVDAANGSVPAKAWGLLGDLTVHNWYTTVYGTFSDQVNKMIQGVQNLATDIKSTADAYQLNEETVGEKFTDIEADLGEVPTANTAPAGGGKAE